MRELLSKSYKLFWVLIPFVFMYGLFNKEHFSSVNIGANFYVFSDQTFSVVIVIFFILFGLGYWLMDFFQKQLITWMTAYHVYISVFGMLILLVFYGYFQELEIDYAFRETIMMLMFIIAAITIAAQLLFPLNFLVYFLRKKKH